MERKEEREYKEDRFIGHFILNNGVGFVVKYDDSGSPIAEIPLHLLDIKEITDPIDGVDFKVIITPYGPRVRIPLLQIHMGKLQYLKKRLHPSSLESVVLASDPDPIMRVIFEDNSNKLIDLMQNGAASRLNEKYMTRAVRINARTSASVLAMYGCPANAEVRKKMQDYGWKDVLDLL